MENTSGYKIALFTIAVGKDRVCFDSIINDEDKKKKADSLINQIEMIMGLPIIKMLNHIQLDLQKNEMIVSLNKKDGTGDKKSNMYIESSSLYLNLKVDTMNFTVYFDTGGNWGTIAVVVTDKTIILNSDSHSFSIPFQKDGYLSLAFLKQFKSLTFDFHAMQLDGEIK